MNHDLRSEIRSAFDARFEPSPGLATRVLALDPDLPHRRARWPRWASVVATILTIGLVGVVALLVSPARYLVPSLAPSSDTALSEGTFFTEKDGWVIRRTLPVHGPKASAVFYVTHDGGATWTEKLRADGNWFEMSWSPDRRTGVIWTVETTSSDCNPSANNQAGSCPAPLDKLVIYQTTDGGDQWTKRPSPPWMAGGLLGNSVFFRDGTEGWAVSRPDKNFNSQLAVYHTGDGGLSWDRQGDFAPPIRANGAVFGTTQFNLGFSDSMHGWYSARQPAQSGHSGLMATSDGGRTWTEVQLTSPDSSGGMVVGMPKVFGDGRAVLPVEVRGAGAPNASRSKLYAFVSSDRGATWGAPRPMTPAPVTTVGEGPVVEFIDPDHWWVSSQSQMGGDDVQPAPTLTYTSDGGQSFATVPSPRIIQMKFTDRLHGWAEAVAGPQNRNQLLRTADGGRHWTEVVVPN
jgi:photosystem II stability/assembly factor-like uncharacterized protein